MNFPNHSGAPGLPSAIRQQLPSRQMSNSSLPLIKAQAPRCCSANTGWRNVGFRLWYEGTLWFDCTCTLRIERASDDSTRGGSAVTASATTRHQVLQLVPLRKRPRQVGECNTRLCNYVLDRSDRQRGHKDSVISCASKCVKRLYTCCTCAVHAVQTTVQYATTVESEVENGYQV